jgi:hypothetical protein
MPDPVEEFISQYDPNVQKLALAARALVHRLVPDAEEKLLRPWKMVAYGRSKKFCAISPRKAWVNLQFHGGTSLPDSLGLLEGTGKSMRHVKIESLRYLKRKPLAELLLETARLAG